MHHCSSKHDFAWRQRPLWCVSTCNYVRVCARECVPPCSCACVCVCALFTFFVVDREIECLLYDSHQKGKIMLTHSYSYCFLLNPHSLCTLHSQECNIDGIYRDDTLTWDSGYLIRSHDSNFKIEKISLIHYYCTVHCSVLYPCIRIAQYVTRYITQVCMHISSISMPMDWSVLECIGVC